MNGKVDDSGRALVMLAIRASQNARTTFIHAWIDTACTGELAIPKGMIESAQLQQTAGIDARLADGNVMTLEAFTCILSWFGADVAIEVIANEGEFPLLGDGLLIGRRMVVDYTALTVTIE